MERMFIAKPEAGADALTQDPATGICMAQVMMPEIQMVLLYVALICLIILTSKTFQMAWPSEAFTLDESGIMQTLTPTVFDSLHEKGVE